MEKSLTTYSVTQGLIFGLINIVLTMLIYLMGADFFASHFIMLPIILLLIMIIYPVFVTVRYRKFAGGFLSFKDAYKVSFFVMVISGLVTAIFGIILYHLIDPEYPKMVQQRMIEHLTEYMTSLNVSEEKIQQSLNKNDMAEKFTVMGQVKSYLYSIIFYGVFSLIVALIAKKNKDVFEALDNVR